MNKMTIWLLPFCLAASATMAASTNILPGLDYHHGTEPLDGKLVFLLHHNVEETNSTHAASIYEFDLTRRSLRKVADAPKGCFVPSPDGKLFTVVFWNGHWRNDNNTNCFVYSDTSRESWISTFSGTANDLAVVGGHVFLGLSDAGLPRGIVDIDLSGRRQSRIELPSARKRRLERYENLHAPVGETNRIHFRYSGIGEPLGEGRDYETGIYSLDIGSGAIQWFCKSEARKDDSNWIWQTFDNRSLYFEGEEAHRGFKLVSCPMRPDKELKEAPKKTDVQVVHAFSKFPAALEEKYVLQGMSPSGRYAFVRLGKNISRSRFSFGRVETYYLVDVATGKTRVLLADEVARKTEGAMSGVFWVR